MSDTELGVAARDDPLTDPCLGRGTGGQGGVDGCGVGAGSIRCKVFSV